MKYPIVHLWSFCLWKGVAGVWFPWKNSSCRINLCCAADTHSLLSHRDFPSMQRDRAQLCQCPSCWEDLLLLMRFLLFSLFFLFAGKNHLLWDFFQRVMWGFQPHPALPMLSSAEADIRDVSTAMGRGLCWVSKALLPTTASTHLCVRPNLEFRGVSHCVCGLGSSCVGKPRSVSQLTVCISSMSLWGFEKCCKDDIKWGSSLLRIWLAEGGCVLHRLKKWSCFA